jgi:beta-phosphoglucomutase-like phosphatase (HAD superfamily)
VVTRDDEPRGKPAPDSFLEAARRLGTAPADCLAIEDSAPGLAAARAAGMHAVLVAPGEAVETLHDLIPLLGGTARDELTFCAQDRGGDNGLALGA